jgi:hypothetical protein
MFALNIENIFPNTAIRYFSIYAYIEQYSQVDHSKSFWIPIPLVACGAENFPTIENIYHVLPVGAFFCPEIGT